jgi:hypothetical protein
MVASVDTARPAAGPLQFFGLASSPMMFSVSVAADTAPLHRGFRTNCGGPPTLQFTYPPPPAIVRPRLAPPSSQAFGTDATYPPTRLPNRRQPREGYADDVPVPSVMRTSAQRPEGRSTRINCAGFTARLSNRSTTLQLGLIRPEFTGAAAASYRWASGRNGPTDDKAATAGVAPGLPIHGKHGGRLDLRAVFCRQGHR